MRDTTKTPIKSVSVLVTVLDEAQTIGALIDSLAHQTAQPKEVIIIDGGSTDETLSILSSRIAALKSKISWIVQTKKGNRSVGRNAARRLATTKLLAITDAGCVPKRDWLEQLLKKQKSTGSQVVAGYYAGTRRNCFEKAVACYALVQPYNLDESAFLPATRSMLLTTQVFDAVGGFDEDLGLNEDYDFALRLRGLGASFSFAREAVVVWDPPKTLWSAARLFAAYARGDAQAKIFRPKVLLLFARYVVAILLMGIFGLTHPVILTLIAFYGVWAVFKNYVGAGCGSAYLPVLQIVADISVLFGTIRGVIDVFSQKLRRFPSSQ